MALSAVGPRDLIALAVGQVALAAVVLFAHGFRWYTLLGALILILNALRYVRSARRRPNARS